jgi:hypothetical protein
LKKEATMSLAEKDKQTARKKGIVAAAATGGVAALAVVGAPVALTIIAVLPAGYLVRDWFMFRAKRGMRF